MKGLLETFEVKVRHNGEATMLRFNRRSHYQAIEEAQKHGIVEWCRKVPREKVFLGSIKNITLDKPMVEFVEGNPYENAIAMDEMIWKKRQERRENNFKKDKGGIDK